MFRQDRTNPSTAVSNWRGRHDTAKGWPSTAVSSWLNGGLFGGAGMTAFGGIITQYEDGGTTYRVHTFRGSGKFVVSAGSADVDWLIVAGGGASGTAGGGAGGMLTGTGVAVTAGTYPIVVGAGRFERGQQCEHGWCHQRQQLYRSWANHRAWWWLQHEWCLGGGRNERGWFGRWGLLHGISWYRHRWAR